MENILEYKTHSDQRVKRQIGIWLLVGYSMVFIMLILGGATRLTQSGLSIVEWNVIMGIVPPLNDSDWNSAFEKYKQFPEYNILNKTMTVEDFKGIFWWEYIHRVWGRLIGLVFIIPFTIFVFQKKLSVPWIRRLTGVFLIGAFQGFVGWYMVKSGLIDNPHVSHYRLTLHLFLAFSICGLLLWYAAVWLTKNEFEKTIFVNTFVRKFSSAVVMLILLQTMLGGLVAGLKAGYMFNTYPKMGVDWLPEAAWMMEPLWINFLENAVMIQFIHRTMALVVLAAIFVFWIKTRSLELSSRLRMDIMLLVIMAIVQLTLGIITVLFSVPVLWGVAHQAGALVLFSLAVQVRFQLGRHSKNEFDQLEKNESV
ncbi:COX15/CtaA family protein [bacterium]|nr:COX15/CtaA family protein [bacterium]